MPSIDLDYPVFDADNHLYETEEALTKFLPDRLKDAIQYIEIKGRTKIVVRGHITEYIPNPTFEVVARPGAQEDYYRNGNPEGKSFRDIMGKPMKSIPAFREPGARLEQMNDLGIDYALMFPTLASLVEERFKDDPDTIHDIVHALNQWMHEQWSFDYEGRIFATPVITLPNVDKALKELEWCLERGAKTVLVRPAAVPSYNGSTRSFGFEEFDPFWKACAEAGVPVSMHASDSGYAELLNMWEPAKEFLPFAPTAFRTVAMGKRHIEDAIAALVCHGTFTRVPDLRVLSVENGGDWVSHLFHQFESVYSKMPQAFPENPIEAFKRCMYVAPFWEDDFRGLVDLIGADRVMFGSDWPHPEGLADPIRYAEEIEVLGEDNVKKVMGRNLLDLFRIDANTKVPALTA